MKKISLKARYSSNRDCRSTYIIFRSDKQLYTGDTSPVFPFENTTGAKSMP